MNTINSTKSFRLLIDEKISADVLYLWLKRIFFYVLLFLVSSGLSHYLVSEFGSSDYNMASARYMISALIQSEAAIMAIIVTLSLVAVELASSSYSVRMIDLLKLYNPDFWILMIAYIVSMSYGLFILKSIPDEGNREIDMHISFVYYTGIFSFLILFPYLFRTLKTLKPSTLLNMQAMKLTAGNITTAISSDAADPLEKDPIQPLIDIVSSSMLNHDFETTRNGLNIIGLRSKEIFSNEDLEPTELKIIANYIFSRLARFGKFTLNHYDEDATFIVIRNLELLWNELEKSDKREAILEASSSLEQIGVVAADVNQKNILSTVINHLYDIGQKGLNEDLDSESAKVIDSIGSIGVACAGNRMEPWIIEDIIHDISKLGEKSSEMEHCASLKQAQDQLDALKSSIQLEKNTGYFINM
ncbi:Predicted membrane protein [Methanolobus vulcani]|uniref:Predicted membrane protein n=1 Tax=Methanolobus vulcani TaxID=38026 RepID=A0A7Z7B0M2_9EURY|nr:Predicted membrane protein [Methanolobus vulcani]